MKANLIQKAIRAAFIAGFSFAIAGPLSSQEVGTPKEDTTKKPDSGRAARNQVLLLDGEKGFMQVPDSTSLHTISNVITLEAQCLAYSFYPDPGSVNSIVRKNIAEGGENFFLRVRNTDGPTLIEMGLGSQLGVVRAPAEFKTNRWYHLAGTFDGSAVTVYVNGVKIISQPLPGNLAIDSSDLVIGKGDPDFSSGEYFHGMLDEIRVWNVARSPVEIQAAMNTTLTGKESGLVAYWNFENGKADDLSRHGNHGRLEGNARITAAARPTLAPAKVQSGGADKPDTEGLIPEKRLEVLEALWRNLSETYPALEYKGIRGREWIEPALRRVREAKSDQEFYDILLEQMASLKDTHTRIISYPGQPRLESPPVILNQVEGKVAVIRADPETTLSAGEVIVSIQDQPVAECLAAQMKRVCNSTERGRIREACGQLLRGPPGTAVSVSAQGTNGAVRRVSLHRKSQPDFWREPAISARPLGDSIGYIRISRWTDDTIPDQFDQALERFKDAQGIIIDVRGNGGGNDHLADVVNGRLITKPVVSSIDFWRKTGTDQYSRTVGWVQPRGPWTHQGRVAVLIDEASMSACEHFVSGIEAMGRVLLVGLPTNGAGGGPTIIRLPDGTRVAISRALGLRANGVVFEGHGIPPHIYSAPTLKDLRDGRDTALDIAKDWIASGKDLPPRIQPLCESMDAASYTPPSPQRSGFRFPSQVPHTHYAIEVGTNASNRRLEGREEIRLENVPLPLKKLVIDWPYAASEELTIRFQNEPVMILSKGTNGLSASQILIELPQTIEKGKSASLDVEFGLPLRLGKITKLTDWHPRLHWGRNSVADYEVKVRAPSGCLVATSGTFDPAKDSFLATGCRVFGLVFMKDLKVLTAKSGDTEIHGYYDDSTRKCVEFTHQTAVEVIDFYRQWLGFYPHKILHIIPGGLAHPAGGYPVATAIVGIHGQAQMSKAPESHWRFITAHEIGHQYWIEHVLEAPNNFWLMIGLGVYADRAYMLAHGYGDKHERDMIGRYVQGVRQQLDTRMDRLPEEMEDVAFDYNNVVNHGKGFAVISALACTLGKPAFEAAYKRCLAEYNGRALAVPDFQRVCEEESGETLDWFFDQWVRTSRFLSCEIASHETVAAQGKYITTAKVRNLGTMSMPVRVTANFEDGSSQCLFTDRLRDQGSLVFTSAAPLKDIKVDAANELALVLPPPEATVDQLREEISRLNVVGQSDVALQIYSKAKPDTLEKLGASRLFRLGMSLFDGRHDKESLQVFEKCAASDKNADPAYKLLGCVWQGHLLDLLDRRDEAVAAYKAALQYCDSDTDIRHDQYGMRITKSWVEKRIQLPFQRPDPAILDLRKRINDLQWTGDGDRALAIFNETKNISKPESGLPWGKLGLCLYDGKHYPEALQAFKSDSTENPSSFSSLVWQGHLLDLMNRRAEAVACYKQALEMNPSSWVRHDQYGIKIDREWIEQRITTPFQRSDSPTPTLPAQEEAAAEPQLADLLRKLGCDDATIKHPLSVGLFRSTAKPSVKILQKNGRAEVLFGWYQNDHEYQLFENVTGSTPLKTLDPGEKPFGFYIKVEFQGKYQWHTESSRNNSESHVKVFPVIEPGRKSADSYLLCWEDIPLGSEDTDDYQDLIVQVSGVAPATSQEFGHERHTHPQLRFHVWGSVPFPSRLTSTPKNQQILLCICKEAKSAGEIAQQAKISNEECAAGLSDLAKYDLVKATNASKWLANFPIFTQAEVFRANEIGIKYGRLQADLLRNQISNLKEAYERCQVAQCHPWSNTSLIIVGALCADFCVSDRIRFKPEHFDEKFLPPRHPDGRRWGYSGEEVLSSPLPIRKYQFYQNVLEDPEGGLARFGYYSLLEEQRKSPPARPENLRHQTEGRIWLALAAPAAVPEVTGKTGLSSAAIQTAIDKMTRWNPPGLIKDNERYQSSLPILASGDLDLLLPVADRIAEMIFKQVTLPMENEMENEAKTLGLRFPLPSGTSARDIALQILSEEGLIASIPQPPVPWNFGVWGWNGPIKMWEDFQ